ncbi:MAG: hypothetical protein KTR20_02065 [Cellvibrionaceae bacterium]|nr:hypothetical protein [Cellvibrionaceae bacterium]
MSLPTHGLSAINYDSPRGALAPGHLFQTQAAREASGLQPRVASTAYGAAGAQAPDTHLMGEIKVPEEACRVELADGAIDLPVGQVRTLGAFLGGMDIEEGDNITHIAFSNFLRFKEDPSIRLGVSNASDVFSVADMLDNDEVANNVITQLFTRVVRGHENHEVRAIAATLPEVVVENRLPDQPNLDAQLAYVGDSFAGNPRSRLLAALDQGMFQAAEYLAEAYKNQIFNLSGFGDNFHRFQGLLDTALNLGIRTVAGVNTVRKIVNTHLGEAEAIDHINAYCRHRQDISNISFRAIRNSAFGPALSADSETAVLRSWFNLPSSHEFLTALTQLEAALNSGIGLSPNEATTSMIKLLISFMDASDVLSIEGAPGPHRYLKPRTAAAFARLVQAGADINGQRARLQGRSPLQVALQAHDFETAGMLVDIGVDLDYRLNNQGDTILIQAARDSRRGRNNQVKPELYFLLAAGANKSLRNNQGNNAYDFYVHPNPTRRVSSRLNAMLAPNTNLHRGLNLVGRACALVLGVPLGLAALPFRDDSVLAGVMRYVTTWRP